MSRPTGWVLAATASLGLLPGCVSIPAGPGFQDVQEAVRQRSGLTVEWDHAASLEPGVEQRIETLLQEGLTAESAVEIALLNNRRLQATFEQLEITRAELVQAALPRNPVLGGELRFPARPRRPFEFTLSQTLWDLIQLPSRRRLALASFEPAKLRTANEVLDFVAEVRAAFYSLQAAEQIRAMRETVLEAARASAELAIRQREAGNIAALDLENEQALVEQAKLEVAQSESQTLERRERLNVLLGLWGPRASWPIVASLPPLPSEEVNLEALESRAVSQRLDLMAARQEIEAAARARPLSRTGTIGEISVGAHREQEPDGTKTMGPAVEVPIPVYHRGGAARARAEALLRQAQQRYAALAVEARAEVRGARSRLQLARGRAAYYRDVILPRRSRIVETSRQHYDFMLLGAFQLLLARQNEVRAQLESIEALGDYWIARSALERAVGGRLEGENQP